MTASARAFLPSTEFEALFPFHLALSPELLIRQFGPGFARVLPELREGEDLHTHFELLRPRMAKPSVALMREQAKSVFLLRARAKPLTLRGQVVCVDGDPAAFFVGSPWLTDAEQLEGLGLSFADFALHDALGDALVLMRAQQQSLKETQALAAQLASQRNQLEATAAELAEKLREVAAQRDVIRTLSTPVIEVWDGIVVLPIIGGLDQQRAELTTLAALAAVEHKHARTVILDLTGVTTFDGDAIVLIRRVADTLRLLGANCSLVGLTPQLAVAAANLGGVTEGVSVYVTLRAALRGALLNHA